MVLHASSIRLCAPYAAVSFASLALAAPSSAGYYPDTPMPDRHGCEITHCEPIFDGDRYGQRCHWRCPRVPPQRHARPRRFVAPPHPHANAGPQSYQKQYRYEAWPNYSAAAPEDSLVPLAIFGLIAFGILAALSRHFDSIAAARATDEEFDFADEAMRVRERLDAAARDADEIMARYRASMRPPDEKGGSS